MDTLLFSPLMLIIVVALLVASFFLSASETAIISLSKIRLRHMLSRGVKRSQSIQRLISKMDKFIVGILVLNNFVNVAISAIATAVFVFLFHRWGILVSTLVTTFVLLILCEITPKILAIKQTERIALAIAPILEVVLKLFNPIIVFFAAASNFIIKSMGIKTNKRSPLITEEELRLMIELGREEGFLSDEEGRMLQRIFEFGDTQIQDVMIPKSEIVAINLNATYDQMLDLFAEGGHARLPVYRDSLDNIIGIVYARDLHYMIRDKELFVLQDLINEPFFVSGDALVNDVLKKFQKDEVQIAIVADAHHKTLGLVTLENLLEEIVGEIEEKHTRRQR